MNAPTSPPQPKAGSLRLDVALQLLQQSGLALPDTRQSDPAGWLQAVLDGLCELSSRDALTGLANRRQFELAMAREIDRVARAGEPALVLMIDIDHFKRVNDNYGHLIGDEVLLLMSRLMRSSFRFDDRLYRFGGEEFVVLLSSADAAAAQAIADRILQRVADLRVEGYGTPIQLTCSIGVASSETLGVWGEKLISQADAAVYAAKKSGRNQVKVAALAA